ncbi:MAG: Alginate exp protein [Campylobacterota bacterium]|nr:Alginate exp protein [Campylobacterota bacterium]MDQ1268406.1 Alginate exp protein [Campylobacterota bacterium]MDQ1338788.1 Alginate exp protein [Campylobacterota bacterium]
MRKMIKMSMAAVMMMGVGSVSVQAEGVDVLSNIKANGQIRARYEMVDKDNTTPNANAFTNRLAIGVGADLFGTDWLSAYAEMTDVRALNGNYNDASADNGVEAHQVVADAEQTRLTQAYIDMKMGKTKLRIGRQAYNLDNVRFVGTVDWRQMPQTFDAYTITDSTIENLNLFASYVTQVNRVFADEVGANTKNWDTRTLLLNGSYKAMDELKATAYGYLIGQGTGGSTGSDTYGLALTGDVKVSDGLKVSYRAEYAVQTDPSMENSGVTGNVDVDADYMNFTVDADVSGFLAGAQYEVLSGINGAGDTAFSTPLATLHAHNGYGDMFLTTPAKGIEDLALTLGYKSKEFGVLKATYHDFTSEVGSIDYATELDVVYTRAIPGVNGLNGMLKFVDYCAGDTVAEGNYAAQATDMTKVVAMLDYKFATK